MLSIYGRRTWVLVYNLRCPVNPFTFYSKSFLVGLGGISPHSLLRTHTQLYQCPWTFQGSDWLPLRSPLFQGLVLPSPLILLVWNHGWVMRATVPRAPVSLDTPYSHPCRGPDNLKKCMDPANHRTAILFLFPVSRMPFSTSSPQSQSSGLSSLLDPLHPRFKEISYLCLLPCKKCLRQKQNKTQPGYRHATRIGTEKT